jgi:hypothetical protein
MRWLLAILSPLVFFCAFVLGQVTNGPLHEVYGLLAALIATVLLVGAAIDAIVRTDGRRRSSYTSEEDEQMERIRRV